MRSFHLAACGTLFTCLRTALGAALVFCFKGRISDRANRLCFGFAGGVMSAAAVFSLLVPATQQVQETGGSPVLVAVIGFALGVGLLAGLDMLLLRMHALRADEERRRRLLLISAVTLHNIPEGMAVGLSFALAASSNPAALAGACALALGVGVQNVPEGAAISLPLYQGGMGRRRSFLAGALSGVVEPLFGILAALFAAAASQAMPMLMCFSAGAMMWVVLSEMLPAAGERRDGAIAAAVGYALMMALDIGLG